MTDAPDNGPDATIHVESPDAMDALGREIAPFLRPGDLLALSGELGAGKSHLARAIIRARLGDVDADVPSPTYTLVNVYTADDVEIWHADLFRLSDPEELEELGLTDALDHAIALIEWPERWLTLPPRRLDVHIRPVALARQIDVCAVGGGWSEICAMLRQRDK